MRTRATLLLSPGLGTVSFYLKQMQSLRMKQNYE